MRAGHGPAATRSNLMRTRRRLERVERGAGLLRRKREALVSELFRIGRPAVDVRERIGEQAATGYAALVEVLADHGVEAVEAIAWPQRPLVLEMRSAQRWGVQIATIERRPALERDLAARGLAPGSTGSSPVEAAERFEELLEALVDAAPREMLMRRLGRALAETTRRFNTLDRRVAPTLRDERVRIERALDEREREEHLRLKLLVKHRRRSAGGPEDVARG